MNLLTIDDNHDTTQAVSDYCMFHGIDSKEVNEGHKGLFEIQKQEYDLILLDISLPEYTGFDILSQLKKQGVRYKRIVILTALNLKMDDFKDYTEVGVREIVKKPIGLDRLDDVVKSYLMNVTHPIS
ncbi:response regulator [Candidatus Nitrosocosmicus arcticus]|uniref:Putative signal transduction response regulator, reiver domain n=1 Tax=Candidatus Nitrosocosmicus arcticus TaxID=2035267 RepID=A0A557SQX0_9ARCH|nr:response regulator [Candidatus Nitrosocosmicus arcticus]TVP39001.1 putative signal transduction response regulator, reiver domain [Candidatus Nitrosocosmicus arcticus]